MEQATAKHREATPAGGVTPAQLREAERGFKLMLARKFSAAWITENARDLLGQANIEYAEWLERNPPARNPVGWLLTCAYRRALNLLDSERRKPRPVSLDSVYHLADESTPTPEENALDNDRQGLLRKALGHLPPKERKLLALVYFEGMSIRGAGRKLGWQKSAADRHHRSAMEKMLALVGDRSLLSPASLGLAAWAVAKGEGHRLKAAPLEVVADLAREGVAVGIEAVAGGAHRLGELARRLAPFSEPGNAATAGSAGRVAGYCAGAAGVVVCGLVATGANAPDLRPPQAEQRAPAKVQVADSVRAISALPPTATPAPLSPSPQTGSAGRARETESAEVTSRQSRQSEPQPRPEFAPQATGGETVSEFGVEGGAGGEAESAPAPESSGAGSSSPAPSANPSPAPRSPDSTASAEFGL